MMTSRPGLLQKTPIPNETIEKAQKRYTVFTRLRAILQKGVLARICRDRGMPSWVVEEAKNLTCQGCIDAKIG